MSPIERNYCTSFVRFDHSQDGAPFARCRLIRPIMQGWLIEDDITHDMHKNHRVRDAGKSRNRFHVTTMKTIDIGGWWTNTRASVSLIGVYTVYAAAFQYLWCRQPRPLCVLPFSSIFVYYVNKLIINDCFMHLKKKITLSVFLVDIF